MEWPPRSRTSSLLGLLGVGAAVVLGIIVRLEDPLSTPVIPAEDPYTHMIRVKGHLAAGGLKATDTYGQLYPPGMHAAFAALWTYAGGDLPTLFRFGPVVCGGVGILGTGLLLERHAGPGAALVGALGVALVPELVWRTTMMAPTALDVALLPFLFYALLELVTGDLAWAGVALPLAAFLVLAHPWLLGALAVTAAAFVALGLLVPWSPARDGGVSPRGAAAALAIVVLAFAFVLSTCGGICGPGYRKALPVDGLVDWLTPGAFALGLLPAALALWPGAVDRLPANPLASPSWARRLLASLVLALLLAAVALAVRATGTPEHVSLVRMLGWPVLGLAAAGFLAAPFVAGPLAYLGVAFVVATLPLSVFTPLGVEFVAHRMVVYLGLGLAILSGVTVGGLARGLQAGVERARPSRPSSTGSSLLALAVLLLTAGGAGAVVVDETPDPYEGGWYRLYEPCEFWALEDVANRIGDEPSTTVVAGDWRPRIVLDALAPAEPRFWFSQSFFASESERDGLVTQLETDEGSLYVLEERHIRTQRPGLDTSFLEGGSWIHLDSWCGAELGHDHELRLHVHARTM